MRKRRIAWMLALVACATAMTVLVTAQEVQPWIHVKIEGQAGENANINLPVAGPRDRSLDGAGDRRHRWAGQAW